MGTTGTEDTYSRLMGSYAVARAEAKTSGATAWIRAWYEGLSPTDKLAWDSQGKATVHDIILNNGETIEQVAAEVEKLGHYQAAPVPGALPRLMVFGPDMTAFNAWYRADTGADARQWRLIELAIDHMRVTASEGISGYQWLRRQPTSDWALWEQGGAAVQAAVEAAAIAVWQTLLTQAPPTAFHADCAKPALDGWLFTLANDMKSDLGMKLREMVFTELRRRDKLPR